MLAILGDPSLVGDGNFTLTRDRATACARKKLYRTAWADEGFSFELELSRQRERELEKCFRTSRWRCPRRNSSSARPRRWAPDDTTFRFMAARLWCRRHILTPTTSAWRYFNTNTSTLGIFTATPTTEFRAGTGNVVWAAAHNQFFTLLAMTRTNEPAQQILSRVRSRCRQFTRSNMPNLPSPRGIQTALVYPAQTLDGEFLGYAANHACMPGRRNSGRCRSSARNFNNRADLAMNFGTGSGASGALALFLRSCCSRP